MNKLLREPMAALRGAQTQAYLNDMSGVFRSVRLALDLLVTLVQKAPGAAPAAPRNRTWDQLPAGSCSICRFIRIRRKRMLKKGRATKSMKRPALPAELRLPGADKACARPAPWTGGVRTRDQGINSAVVPSAFARLPGLYGKARASGKCGCGFAYKLLNYKDIY